jgi:hypothetical protein
MTLVKNSALLRGKNPPLKKLPERRLKQLLKRLPASQQVNQASRQGKQVRSDQFD